MNWAQENKTLAGIIGVMAVGGLGLGVWLYFSWAGYSDSMEQWQQTQSRIATIRGKKLAPTPENVTLRQRHLDEMAEKVNQLRGGLLTVQQVPKPMSETEFQAHMKDRATEVRRMANTITTLPEDFALGFEKYAAQPPRSAEIAAELNIHLDAMEKLVTTCIDAGVTSIDLLERTRLANEDAPLPPKPAPTKAKTTRGSSGSRKAKKPVITVQAAAEPVLDRYPVKLVITTDQGPFQTVVNTLCHPGKMPHFLVLRQLRVENTRLDGPTKEEVVQKRNATVRPVDEPTAPPKEPSEAGKPAGPTLITPPKPAPADAFEIMGGELLKVYMEVDYIRFRPAAEVEEEEVSAPTASANP